MGKPEQTPDDGYPPAGNLLSGGDIPRVPCGRYHALAGEP